MLVVIKGAGDIASGIALRLYRARFDIVMTEIDKPTAIRRTVSFSQAVSEGSTAVEGVTAELVRNADEAKNALLRGNIAIIVDPEAACIEALKADAVVDAVLAKTNRGTRITDAPVVVAVGPGFVAGEDCHAVVETQRGHALGRVITQGAAAPNTGIPGNIGGYTIERILRAPADGMFRAKRAIGEQVQAGDIAGEVDGVPMRCQIAGVLRGILPDHTPVHKGMKSGDVDPRSEVEHCFSVSDKALCVGGAVLEAILRYTPRTQIDLRSSQEWKPM